MTIFKKRKYKKYIDYLKDNRTELFAAWIGPEILKITGITAAQLLKGNYQVKTNISFEDALRCLDLMRARVNSNPEFVVRFSNTFGIISDEMMEKYGKNMDSGIYAADERFQVPSIIEIINQIRDETLVQKETCQYSTCEEVIKNINGYFSLLPTLWKLNEINIAEMALTEAHKVRKTTLLNQIKTD